MTASDLIASLGHHPPRRRFPSPSTIVGAAALISLTLALALSIVWLKPRGDLGAPLVINNHIFLLKLVFTLSVVAAALPIVRDLSVPARRVGRESILVAIPFAVIIVLALREIGLHQVAEWPPHADHAVLECLWQIPALAASALIILALAARRLAPTNLTRAGAYIGLLAGGIGAVGYALHCHNDSVAFVAIAYTVAMLQTTLLGAVLGPRILRWA